MQGRKTDRWYFVLAGRISKVQTMELTAGVKKQFFADLIQGNSTDVDEVIQGDDREYSLLCHTNVEMLLLEREDIEEVFASTTGQGSNILDFLKSIDLFSTYPLDSLYAERDALTIKYYAKDTVIGDSDTDSKYLYILKSGSGTLHVKSNSFSQRHRREGLEETHMVTSNGASSPTLELLSEEEATQSSVFDKCDMYGFDTILERALKKVQNGIGANYFEDVVLPEPTHSKLVSDGAECVLISKISFLKISDFCTLCKLITTHLNKDPPQNPVAKKQENTAGWNRFKEEVIQDIVNRK
jgi:CRP-like cAMP-binding protein